MDRLTVKLLRALVAPFVVMLLLSARASADEYRNNSIGIHVGRPQNLEWDDLNVGWWRIWDTHDTWPFLQPGPSSFDWTQMDSHVAWAQTHHLKIVYVLGLSPAWASSKPTAGSAFAPGNAAPPNDLSVWGDFVEAVAKRYKGKINYYEIWNESDHPAFFSGSTDDYIALVKTAATRLRAVDPGIKILAPSATGGKGAGYIKELLQKAGQYVDIVSFHGYTESTSRDWYPPEIGTRKIELMQQAIRDSGISRPLWDTEVGFPPNEMDKLKFSGSRSERLGDYLVRAVAVNLSSGVQNVFWYSWDNKVIGYLEDDASEKGKAPARVALQTLARLTVACQWGARGAAPSADVWLVPCRGKTSDVVVAWTTNKEVDAEFTGAWSFFDLLGRELHGGSIRLTQSPIYAIKAAGSTANVRIVQGK